MTMDAMQNPDPEGSLRRFDERHKYQDLLFALESDIDVLAASRDELLALVIQCRDEISAWHEDIAEMDRMEHPEVWLWHELKAAIAKAQGEGQGDG